MNPKQQTKVQLIEALRNIAQAIEADDSFEGSIEYSIAGPQLFDVRAFWRVGNSMGQGGSISIGAFPE